MTWLGATGLVGGGHCGAGGDIIVFGGAQTVEDGTKLVLDGGTDNDWQYAASGEEAIIVGGLCRDVVFSKSAGGILWGDVENSFLRKGDGARVYVKDGTEHVIADDKTSAVAGNPVMVTYSDGTVAQARVYENDVKTVMALQGGLEDYARGLSNDAARDVCAPMSAGNLLCSTVGVDQAFIMQMLISAFEARGWTFDPATGLGTGLDICGAAQQSRRGAAFRFNRREMTA
jgi:hypothetical protein